MRDDFSQKTKDTLAKRVGYICSNPDCRMLTVGPNSEITSNTNIGVAAHISAASRGGPRFNTKLSLEQRQGIENGIWLCQSCSRLIDRDPQKYAFDVLKKWKKDNESEAAEKINKQSNILEPLPNRTNIKELDPNGFYETEFKGQKIRFCVDGEDHLHIEHEPIKGIVSYHVIDKEGKWLDQKWPFPLKDYKIIIDPELIIKTNKEVLSTGQCKETIKMKWGKEAIITRDANGELFHFKIKKGCTISHVDRKIWIDPPDFIRTGSLS